MGELVAIYLPESGAKNLLVARKIRNVHPNVCECNVCEFGHKKSR